MNEYLIRFADGTTKHIKADSCVFMNLPGADVGNKPCAVFYRKHVMYYVITLDSISAIRFPEAEESDNE